MIENRPPGYIKPSSKQPSDQTKAKREKKDKTVKLATGALTSKPKMFLGLRVPKLGKIPKEKIQSTQLKDLPPEMVLKILSSIRGSSTEITEALLNFGLTNSEYNILAEDFSVWQELFQQPKEEYKKAPSEYLEYKKIFIKTGSMGESFEEIEAFLATAFQYEKNPKIKKKIFEELLNLTEFSFNATNEGGGLVNLCTQSLDHWRKDLKLNSKILKNLNTILKNREDKINPGEITLELKHFIEKCRNKPPKN